MVISLILPASLLLRLIEFLFKQSKRFTFFILRANNKKYRKRISKSNTNRKPFHSKEVTIYSSEGFQSLHVFCFFIYFIFRNKQKRWWFKFGQQSKVRDGFYKINVFRLKCQQNRNATSNDGIKNRWNTLFFQLEII